MKTKEIIAAGLFTLALLAGCNKAEEPAATNTTESSPSATSGSPTEATPVPAEEPAATTEESTPPTATTAPSTENQ